MLNFGAFFKTTIYTCKNILRHGIPSHVLYFGEALGDNLLLTVLAKELNLRNNKKVWIKSDHPALFYNNVDVSLVVPFDTPLSTLVLKMAGIKLVHPTYTTYNQTLDQDQLPKKHILLKMADCVNLSGRIDLKPVLQLNLKEQQQGKYASNQIAIATSSANAKVPMKNKEWLAERYQEVVDYLKTTYTIVQIGAKDDYALEGVTDLRGKTSLRETAAILENTRLMITHVGFLMHLARAVDCPSVIIFGGREHPEQSGYASFSNIYSPVECAPCWQRNLCHYNKKCMSNILAADVVRVIEKELAHEKLPLSIDVLSND